jgi:hypothetical protein
MTAITMKVLYVCDTCNKQLTIELNEVFLDNFKTANSKIKDHGWQHKYKGGRYCHYCDKCIEPSIRVKSEEIK